MSFALPVNARPLTPTRREGTIAMYPLFKEAVMAKVVKRSVLPIYAVAVVWLIFGLFLPFYRPLHYVAAVLVSLVVFLIAKSLCPDRTFETP